MIFFSKIRSFFSEFIFFIRNVLAVKKIKVIGCTEHNGYFLSSLNSDHFVDALTLYSDLNKTPRPNLFRRLAYKVNQKKMMFSVVDSNNNLVGLEIFYFNRRDAKENTVHEGFVGIVESCRGLGISTKLRRHSLSHFESSGLSGISSRISLNNVPSLRSAEKLGFKPVERYFDQAMSEERYYLVCLFKDSSKNVE